MITCTAKPFQDRPVALCLMPKALKMTIEDKPLLFGHTLRAIGKGSHFLRVFRAVTLPLRLGYDRADIQYQNDEKKMGENLYFQILFQNHPTPRDMRIASAAALPFWRQSFCRDVEANTPILSISSMYTIISSFSILFDPAHLFPV